MPWATKLKLRVEVLRFGLLGLGGLRVEGLGFLGVLWFWLEGLGVLRLGGSGV